MDGVAKLDELRGRLAGLSRLLGGGDAIPTAPQPPPAAKLVHAARTSPPRRPSPPKTAAAARQHSQPPFKAVIPPSKSVLRSTNTQPAGAVGSALAAFKQEEAKWLAQKGELQMMLNREKKRALKLEAELKRSQEMHQYRVGEVKHLKAALKQRGDQITELQDRVRELELCNTADKLAREAVEAAEAERDELRGAMQEMLDRLAHTNEIMVHTDQAIAGMEAKVQTMEAERQEAVQQAADAAADAASLRETIKELEWKCSMLQQLADMTLQQNEEKMSALRQLLQSESLLDAEAGDAVDDLELAVASWPGEDEDTVNDSGSSSSSSGGGSSLGSP